MAEQKKESVHPDMLGLINIEAVKRLAEKYGKETYLPRVVGRSYDILDEHGKQVPVGHLIILPKFIQQFEQLLLGPLEERFQATAYAMSASLNADSGGVVEEKYRVVLGFPGSLKVDRIDRVA